MKLFPPVKQLHEVAGWRLLSAASPTKKYEHSSNPYRITTIAVALSNIEEAKVYFNAEGKPTTLLDVSLHEYVLRAREKGTGFITGNFYDPTATPVISIEPRPKSEQPECKVEAAFSLF